MKTLMILLSCLVFSFRGVAQESNVPVKVKNAFSKAYPDVKDVKWDTEGNDEYEATFSLNGVKTSVVIEEDGDIEETETEINLNDLPPSIIPFINSNYKDYSISEAAKIVDEDGNINFETEISKGNERKDLLFDQQGIIVKKHSKESKEDEENDEQDED